MGGLPETHVMYHSTHITDIITDRGDVRHPSYRLNTHNLLYRESRRQSKESQHSFDAQRGRYQARDEEHARLRDEEHARPSGCKRFLCVADQLP